MEDERPPGPNRRQRDIFQVKCVDPLQHRIFVLVYVDDIIVASASQEAASTLVKNLEKEFALKDLGDLHYFLEIEVSRSKDSLVMTQGRYALEILQQVGMTECKAADTPLSISERLFSI